LDRQVNAADRAIIIANLNTAGGWARGDLNGDGQVNGADLTLLNRAIACSPADIATEGSTDLNAGPDGFLTGTDFDAFVQAFFTDYRNAGSVLIADLTNDSGTGGPDGFLTGADFDRFIVLFFSGC
ncbi:MAG: hypothetical protein KIT68_13570, partial [Phycisphaeraceae bacterium]|nr:hypothetical protein [Phycisphaeraceae bacterium]